jgi:hypothetical protein
MIMLQTPNMIDDDLFDESAGYEDDTGIKFAPDLNEWQKKQAMALYRLFRNLWGLCIIRGEPGAGKDTFLNWLLYNVKRYFPDKRILRDEKPRKLFGHYDGLFNDEIIRDDLRRMREIAKGVQEKEEASRFDGTYSRALERAADEWVASDGAKVLLQNAVVGLTEYWDYVYNRNSGKPMNKTMGAIHKMARHMNTLILGCVQLESDLDKKTCKPFINLRVSCVRSGKDSTRYMFFVEKVKYDARMDTLIPVSKAYPIPIDAGKPRSFIGDGKIEIRKPNYVAQSEYEEVILDCIKEGLDTYEGLVDYLGSKGCMDEGEVLSVLKELCLFLPWMRKPKCVIWYPCYYFIFNSRSAPSLRTTLKAGDS